MSRAETKPPHLARSIPQTRRPCLWQLSAASIAGTLKQQPGKHFDTLPPPFIALLQTLIFECSFFRIRTRGDFEPQLLPQPPAPVLVKRVPQSGNGGIPVFPNAGAAMNLFDIGQVVCSYSSPRCERGQWGHCQCTHDCHVCVCRRFNYMHAHVERFGNMPGAGVLPHLQLRHSRLGSVYIKKTPLGIKFASKIGFCALVCAR